MTLTKVFLLGLCVLGGLTACQTAPVEQQRKDAQVREQPGSASALDDMSEQERYEYYVQTYTQRARAKDWEAAHIFARRATELSVSTAYAWLNRAAFASQLQDYADVAFSLLHVAKYYPDELSKYDSRFISSMIRNVRNAEELKADYRTLLEALFDAGWKLKYSQPGYFWRDLVLMNLESGQVDEAKRVAQRIDNPLLVISMRSDKRFDRLTQTVPEQFDVEKIAQLYMEGLSTQFRQNPYSLELLTELTYGLIMEQRYQEIILITEPVVTALNNHEEDPPPYVGFERYLNWIFNNRAIALESMGELRPGIELLTLASFLPENGNTNVSQVINLAQTLCYFGEVDAAKRTLERVGKSSAYGLMQVKTVQFCIAVQSGEESEIDEALDFMREHKGDAQATYIDALLATGAMDEVAESWIAWVNDPEKRIDALYYLQDFAEPPLVSPYDQMLSRGRQALRDIPRVRDAINQYGRVESYSIRDLGG